MQIDQIGNTIRKLREEKGMSREDLARESGIPATTITKIEHGDIKNPGIEKIAKIAQALGVKIDELVTAA